MTQTTLNNYMLKLAEIQSRCNDETTTKTQLETLLNQLSTLDDLVDVELETLPFPTMTAHINSLILVQVARSRKIELHSALLNLVDTRKHHFKTILDPINGDPVALKAYETENNSVESYVETVKSGCDCMRSRSRIIEVEVEKKNAKK